jgi:hypothetical protein
MPPRSWAKWWILIFIGVYLMLIELKDKKDSEKKGEYTRVHFNGRNYRVVDNERDFWTAIINGEWVLPKKPFPQPFNWQGDFSNAKISPELLEALGKPEGWKPMSDFFEQYPNLKDYCEYVDWVKCNNQGWK